ncbi:MAG: hypothetical protein ACI4WX_01690 [Aristaeellaceae bacterium]
MLIRNARIEGFSALVDLRLMHGAVQEIGVGLCKGLYEAELDLAGDELRPCPPDMELPARFRRHALAERIVPGTREPLLRWHEGKACGLIHSHSAD